MPSPKRQPPRDSNDRQDAESYHNKGQSRSKSHPRRERDNTSQSPLHLEKECEIPDRREGERQPRPRRPRRSRRCTLRIQRKARWKDLTWETRLLNHHLHIAERKIDLYRNEIMCLHGYCADGNLPTWKNKENHIGNMTPAEYLSRPANIACHDLRERNPRPQGARCLLGLGLKFCTLRARPTNRINKTIDRVKADVRRMAFF